MIPVTISISAGCNIGAKATLLTHYLLYCIQAISRFEK